MSEPNDLDIIARTASRAADRGFFLASALRQFQISHGLDEAGLAEVLGCSTETLPRLALCRRPSTDLPAFRSDVEAIAQRLGVRALQLAQMLRDVDSQQAIQSARGVSSTGMLMAARDRRPPKSRKVRRREH